MTNQEYYDRLTNHDWYYSMSDDFRVYTRGKDDMDELRELSTTKESFRNMFSDYCRFKRGEIDCRPEVNEYA